MQRELKNIAIIAHIDHGKTTMVDGLLKQSGVFRPGQKVDERVIDSNDLERERGITILSKNTSVQYGDTLINIVDTPGHADFAGEVERVLGMVDGCLLVVDAAEGPMAQTRFVVSKALAQGLTPILVINKIDRPDGRPAQVVDEVLELFFALDAQDHQIDFPIVYCSAKDQVASMEVDGKYENLAPLFEAIVKHVPSPKGDPDAPLQLRVSSLDYDDYIGRLCIGRISQGTRKADSSIVYGTPNDETLHKNRLSGLFLFDGLGRKKADTASVGDIVVVSGLVDVEIGDTITDPESPSLLTPITVDEPTLAMNFMTSDSPLAGQDGKLVTSRHLKERLEKELERNVALRVIPTDSPDTVDPPEEYVCAVVERLGERKGEMLNMTGAGTGRVRLVYRIPMRGLIGFRSELLTLTRGYGIMSHLNDGYGPFKGEMRTRHRGSLIASDAGVATTYALHQLQDRGSYFIKPQDTVYAGMVVGEHCRPGDLEVNVCKKKQVTNIRSSNAEQTLRREVPREMNLEKALEYIADDELVEITPNSVRIRKRHLCTHVRARIRKEKKAALQAAES